ncbi:MAG TPA: SDR family oxidoreductase [Stellaceae bacterium]|nr:SDR family oxidoreductase [Stellaceae bacterium]
MNIKDGVAIVTGSATGIGAESAKLLASRGCRVVINYTKSRAEAEETAAACRGCGVDVLLHQADIADDQACRAMAAAAIERWGRIDALVNSAGKTKPAKPGDLEALNGPDFLEIYAVNVVGTYQMIRAVVPQMKKQGNGAIVNVSALGSLDGEGSSIAYGASKGAINSMTIALARQLAPTIRVNAVAPGFVATRWMKNLLGEQRFNERVAEMAKITPVGKTAFAEDIAQMVCWFIDGPDLITGEVLPIDYGTRFGKLTPKA